MYFMSWILFYPLFFLLDRKISKRKGKILQKIIIFDELKWFLVWVAIGLILTLISN